MMRVDKNLVKGSFILIISFGIFNLFHFLFQSSMARYLTISEYGVLATLLSIAYISMVLSESIQIIITRYSAKEKSEGRLKNLLKRSLKKGEFVSIRLFLFYLFVSLPLSYFLRINYFLLSLNGLIIFISTSLPITRGILQGKEKFKSLGLNMIIESGVKLVIGLAFVVLLNWKVYGAIGGIISGGAIAFAFSLLSLRRILKSKEEIIEIQGIYTYARPAFLITLLMVVFYSIDIIIAKMIFSPEVAGAYAIASILGKIVLWGTIPVGKAMFPLSSEDYLANHKSSILGNAMTILFIGISFVLIVSYFFADSLIKIFSGKIIPEAASILFFLSIAFSFISLANLILLYKLSIGKFKRYYYLFIFLVLEIILLIFFSNNLYQFSIAFITSSAALLWGSIFLMNE